MIVNSYSIVLMLIYFLQQKGVLPALDVVAHGATLDVDCLPLSGEDIEKCVARCMTDTKMEWSLLGSPCTVLFRFFVFWGSEFQYNDTVASIRSLVVLTKEEKGWECKSKSTLCLEDPLELDRDLGKTLSTTKQKVLRSELYRSLVLLTEGTISPSTMMNLLCRERHSVADEFHMGGDFHPYVLNPYTKENVTSLSTTEDLMHLIPLLKSCTSFGLHCSTGREGVLIHVEICIEEQVFCLKHNKAHSALSKLLFENSSIRNVLEDESVMKIVHDVRQTCTAILKEYGITLKGVFDTQLAHWILHINEFDKKTTSDRNVKAALDKKVVPSLRIAMQSTCTLHFLLQRYLSLQVREFKRSNDNPIQVRFLPTLFTILKPLIDNDTKTKSTYAEHLCKRFRSGQNPPNVYAKLQVGSTVMGLLLYVNDTEVGVDLGSKYDARISRKIENEKCDKNLMHVNIGDEIMTTVVKMDRHFVTLGWCT